MRRTELRGLNEDLLYSRSSVWDDPSYTGAERVRVRVLSLAGWRRTFDKANDFTIGYQDVVAEAEQVPGTSAQVLVAKISERGDAVERDEQGRIIAMAVYPRHLRMTWAAAYYDIVSVAADNATLNEERAVAQAQADLDRDIADLKDSRISVSATLNEDRDVVVSLDDFHTLVGKCTAELNAYLAT